MWPSRAKGLFRVTFAVDRFCRLKRFLTALLVIYIRFLAMLLVDNNLVSCILISLIRACDYWNKPYSFEILLYNTLGARGFFYLWGRQNWAVKPAKRERKNTLAPTDNNLTYMPTPVSFDWHTQSELILETQQTGFIHVAVKYACDVSCLRFLNHWALSSTRNL